MITKDSVLNSLAISKFPLAKFGVSRIGLFGSFLRGEQTNNSDIDLLIDFNPEAETYDNLMAVYDYFERTFQNQKIDIVTKNGLSPHIGPHILNEVLYV